MGDIIEFPTLARELPQTDQGQSPPRKVTGPSPETLAVLGGEAYRQLHAWKRSIHVEDRESMARNMDALLNESRLKPRHLNWTAYYRDRESFNRDLSRMRLPEGAAPGRRLMGHVPPWEKLLELIRGAQEQKGENTTLEALAERLTRGTRFHPVQRVRTLEEKLLYTLKLWANQVDENTGLLRTFKRLGELRAEHYRLHLSELDNKAEAPEPSLEICPSDYFEQIPEALQALFDRRLGDYTDDDWQSLFASIPESCVYQFEMYRDEIANWKSNFDPQGTLFSKEWGETRPQFELSGLGGFQYLPRWYLGMIDYDRKRKLDQYDRKYFPDGTHDPLRHRPFGKDTDLCCYLVLYPNPELSRILPYLLHWDEEGSFCEALTEEWLTESSLETLYFPPSDPDTPCVSKPLIARIEEAFDIIARDWESTAHYLQQHPYFQWQAERGARISGELARLTSLHRDKAVKQEAEGADSRESN